MRIIPSNNILIFPSHLVTQSSHCAVFSPRLQPKDTEGLWNNYTLLLVVWWWDAFEDLQSLHCRSTACSLVGNHASYSLVENSSRSTEMERTTTRRVVSSLLSKIGMVLDCEMIYELVIGPKKASRKGISGLGVIDRSHREQRMIDIRLARKNSPEMLRASHRTTTTFCPFNSCFATVLARRPSK